MKRKLTKGYEEYEDHFLEEKKMKNSEEEKKGQTTENDLNFYLYTNIYILWSFLMMK